MNQPWRTRPFTKSLLLAAVAGLALGSAVGTPAASAQTARPAAAPAQRRAPAPAAADAAATAAAPEGQGLDALDDQVLMGELAGRGLDTLLDRAFEVNKVPQSQRAGMKAFGALRELTDKAKPPTPARRQQLLGQIVAGSKTVLPSLKDPSKLMEYAALLITEGAMRDVNTIEYWGENPATQARLRPVMGAVTAMLDKAAAEAGSAKAAVEKSMRNVNDTASADRWTQLDELENNAKYTRHMADYYVALSLPRDKAGLAEQARIADPALEFFKELDNADSGVQPAVRNRSAKLLMTKGEFAEAKALFQSVIDKKELAPEPDPFQQYEARYFSAVCDLETGNAEAAKRSLAELLTWQKANLPADKAVQNGVSAAARPRARAATPTPPGPPTTRRSRCC